MGLCTRDELVRAYSLLLEPDEVDPLVEEFFEVHPPDRDGRAMWNYRGPHSADPAAGGLVVSDAARSSDNANWAKQLLLLTRKGRRDVLLTIDGPTLELLMLASDDVAGRVQKATSLSDAEVARIRDETQRSVELAKQRGR